MNRPLVLKLSKLKLGIGSFPIIVVHRLQGGRVVDSGVSVIHVSVSLQVPQ